MGREAVGGEGLRPFWKWLLFDPAGLSAPALNHTIPKQAP